MRRAMSIYHRIPIRFIDVDVTQSLTHSDNLGIYAYDAYMIEAARQQQCPLLTLDRGLIHAARMAGVEVLEVDV